MHKLIILVFLSFLFPLNSLAAEKDITLSIVYNNVIYDKNLTAAWGFSCLVEGLEKNILFDTGGDGNILLSNMKKLKVNAQDINIVVLSHIHGDHTGGLWDVLEENNQIIVYLPFSFPESLKNRAYKMCKGVISVDKPAEICKEVWSTGELGTWIKEQSLVINTRKGLVIISGCAHPGIVNIVKFVKSYFHKDVYLVMGGFHLTAYNDKQIEAIIKDLKELKVEKVGPSHCTGERAVELFRQSWGKNFCELGCGAKIKIVD